MEEWDFNNNLYYLCKATKGRKTSGMESQNIEYKESWKDEL